MTVHQTEGAAIRGGDGGTGNAAAVRSSMSVKLVVCRGIGHLSLAKMSIRHCPGVSIPHI